MTPDKFRFNIVSGPSREELFDGLRLRHEGRKIFFLAATTSGNFEINCILNSISIECGSGNCWLLKLRNPESRLRGCDRLEMFYNSSTRSGWVDAIA